MLRQLYSCHHAVAHANQRLCFINVPLRCPAPQVSNYWGARQNGISLHTSELRKTGLGYLAIVTRENSQQRTWTIRPFRGWLYMGRVPGIRQYKQVSHVKATNFHNVIMYYYYYIRVTITILESYTLSDDTLFGFIFVIRLGSEFGLFFVLYYLFFSM